MQSFFLSFLDKESVLSVIPERFTHDETEDFRFEPVLVLLPETTEQISLIMKYCFEHEIPVTPRGAGSGLAGGALPVKGGVVVCVEKMNTILEIDERNLQATVQPGVITGEFQKQLIEKGLFYPPDPASKEWSFIGGNVATGAGGPKAVKYGTVKDYIINLEVVLPDGSIIWTGANTLKNSTGYNLTQLFVGSEGTLGIVTKIVVRLLPYPQHSLLLLAPFQKTEDACLAVSAIFRAGITPSGLEFMEKAAIERSLDYIEGTPFSLRDKIKHQIENEGIAAHLLIEVDGNYIETLYSDCEKINEVLEQYNCGEILFADSQAQKDEIWRLRRVTGVATKKGSIYKEEDTVVPRAELATLLKGVKEIGEKFDFESICYGHAGDGNLHVNILKGKLTEEQWENDIPLGIREIFKLVKTLGGILSGEHGIGFVQRRYMDIFFSETELNILKNIKKAFDPKGIMNPGKIL